MARVITPLLTRDTELRMQASLTDGQPDWTGSLDLGRTSERIPIDDRGFYWRNQHWPWPQPHALKDRTIYGWDGEAYRSVQRFNGTLIKLVPTEWSTPTFEIDGIKMLPSARSSPWADAGAKVALVSPRGRRILDCCGGLGYFAAHALAQNAALVESVEKNPDVLWLRSVNPWSPDVDDPDLNGRFTLREGDISRIISQFPAAHFDAALHDPPRFGIAGELYSQVFYEQLARVLKPQAPVFHYTGSPNAKTSGRDVPAEVIRRLERAGFRARRALDGVFAERLPQRPR